MYPYAHKISNVFCHHNMDFIEDFWSKDLNMASKTFNHLKNFHF